MTRTRVLAALAAAVLLAAGIGLGALLFGSRADEQPVQPAPSRVDVGFAQDMIVHHQQAVDLAAIAGPRLRGQTAAIAEQIRAGQQREIGQLQGWLTVWDAPQIADEPMTWMSGHDHHGGQHGAGHGAGHGGQHGAGDGAGEQPPMPGMASMPELQRLGELRGEALQRRFCQLMLRHHQGGVAMAQEAAEKASEPFVRAAAAVMAAEQQKESATLSALLRDHGGEPLPQR